MTPEEKEIMADMFYFLRDHCDPPAVGISGTASKMGFAISSIGRICARDAVMAASARKAAFTMP